MAKDKKTWESRDNDRGKGDRGKGETKKADNKIQREQKVTSKKEEINGECMCLREHQGGEKRRTKEKERFVSSAHNNAGALLAAGSYVNPSRREENSFTIPDIFPRP